MGTRARRYAVVAVAAAAVASILASVLLRESARLSEKDTAVLDALADLDDALAWRDRAEKAVPADLSDEWLTANGYISLREDEFSDWVHFINWGYIDDDRQLDPGQPEAYLFKILPDGGRRLAALVFAMPERFTYANTPDLADGAALWHMHPTTCLGGDPFSEPEKAWIDGACIAGPNFPPRLMTHAWVTPNLCGPFASVILEDDPGLTDASRQYIRERLGGADRNGEIPGCEEDLARRVWPDAFD